MSLYDILGKTKQGFGAISPNVEEFLATIPLLLGSYEQAKGVPIGAPLGAVGQLLMQHGGYRQSEGDINAVQNILGAIDQTQSPVAYKEAQQLLPLLSTMSPEEALKQEQSVQGMAQSEELAREKYHQPIQFWNNDTKSYVYHHPEDFPNGQVPGNLAPASVGVAYQKTQADQKAQFLNYGDDANQMLAEHYGFTSKQQIADFASKNPAEFKKTMADINRRIQQDKLKAAVERTIMEKEDAPIDIKTIANLRDKNGNPWTAGMAPTGNQAMQAGFRYYTPDELRTIARTKLAFSDLAQVKPGLELLRTSRPASFTSTFIANAKGDPRIVDLLQTNLAMLAAANEYSNTLRINTQELAVIQGLRIDKSDTIASATEKINKLDIQLSLMAQDLGLDPVAMKKEVNAKLATFDPTAAEDSLLEKLRSLKIGPASK